MNTHLALLHRAYLEMESAVLILTKNQDHENEWLCRCCGESTKGENGPSQIKHDMHCMAGNAKASYNEWRQANEKSEVTS